MAKMTRRGFVIALVATPVAVYAMQTAVPTDPVLNARLSLPVPANLQLPTLFLVGDSTVRNGHGDGANNQMGWGEPLVAYFDPTKINVVNRAIGGRSSRTHLTEGHWADVLAMLKPGDTVLLQFGHMTAECRTSQRGRGHRCRGLATTQSRSRTRY